MKDITNTRTNIDIYFEIFTYEYLLIEFLNIYLSSFFIVKWFLFKLKIQISKC